MKIIEYLNEEPQKKDIKRLYVLIHVSLGYYFFDTGGLWYGVFWSPTQNHIFAFIIGLFCGVLFIKIVANHTSVKFTTILINFKYILFCFVFEFVCFALLVLFVLYDITILLPLFFISIPVTIFFINLFINEYVSNVNES